MNIFKAHNIPQITKLIGIRYIPIKNFSRFGFKLERLMIPDMARVT